MHVRMSIAPTALLLLNGSCWAYGGGNGGASCEEPKFFTESPSNNSTVPALSDFSFIASDVEPESLSVKVNGTAVSATLTPMANGDVQATLHLANPITMPGRVQVAVGAKSTEGCFGFRAYYVQVK